MMCHISAIVRLDFLCFFLSNLISWSSYGISCQCWIEFPYEHFDWNSILVYSEWDEWFYSEIIMFMAEYEIWKILCHFRGKIISVIDKNNFLFKQCLPDQQNVPLIRSECSKCNNNSAALNIQIITLMNSCELFENHWPMVVFLTENVLYVHDKPFERNDRQESKKFAFEPMPSTNDILCFAFERELLPIQPKSNHIKFGKNSYWFHLLYSSFVQILYHWFL